MNITPTSLSFNQLLGAPNERYVVPAYQRRYSWTEKQLWEFLDDISLIQGEDRHLLGTLVCLTGNHVAGLNNLELVDGQQRLTTVSILLACIRDRLVEENETSAAKEIDQILIAKALGKDAVSKICLDSVDSCEYDRHIRGEAIESPKNRNLEKAFTLFRRWVAEKEIGELGTFLYHLRNHTIVIRLDVGQAKDAFKLFETINNRGLRLSPADIIKNFLLGNAARLDQSLLDQAKARWAELISNLDSVNSEAFFRHFLCAKLKRRITRSYVIGNFKTLFMQQVAEAADLPDRHWYLNDNELAEEEEDDADGVDSENQVTDDESAPGSKNGDRVSFSCFMENLSSSAKIYGEIVRCETGNAEIDCRLRNLRMIKSAQTYGFLMFLRANACKDSDFLNILRMTEAFVLRRHICRSRSNESETAFAKLCGIDCSSPTQEVIETYRQYSPPDERLRDEFVSVTFKSALMDRARYCLEQIELSHHGDNGELSVAGPGAVHIEHIIPQKIKTRKARKEYGDWVKYLGPNSESEHPRYVSRLGNLTLLSGPLNITASNNPYGRKLPTYAASGIKITQLLPRQFPEFRFGQIQERSEEFADKAIELWPIP